MATQLLLIKDVEDLGRSGDVIKVKPGYARNYLLPQGLGVTANKNALRMQDRLQEERRKRAAEDRKESEKFAVELEGKIFITYVKVDPEGHMYGSVSANDIKKLLEEEAKIILGKKGVQLKQPIKQTGNYPITLKFKEEVTTSVIVKVLAEGTTETEEESAEESTESAEESSESTEESSESTEESVE